MLLALFLLAINANAKDNFEILGGGLTYHLLDVPSVSNQYENKLADEGRLISNLMVGMQVLSEDKDHYESAAFFVGQNSIAEPMGGFMLSKGIILDNWYLGPILGAYLENDTGFVKRGIRPFSIMKVYNDSIVPIAGAEANYRIDLKRDRYIKINNIVTPALINSTVSYGFSF